MIASIRLRARSIVHRVGRLARSSVLHSPYYRRNPVELVRLIDARRRLAAAAVADPRDLVARLGLDPDTSAADYERWRPVLEPVIAGKSRVGISEAEGWILYTIVRALRPLHVIETGVAEGVSTSFIGAALVDNGDGLIHSLELAPEQVRDDSALEDGSVYRWQHRGVGFLVPHDVRVALGDRWDVRLGDVRETLPVLLRELPSVDVFFHDDLHVPPHMLWEYELVWPRLAGGGVLLSDDANQGWVRFARRGMLGPEPLLNYRRLAAARHP